MKTITNTIYLAFALLGFACFALSPMADAVVPPPDGGYPNGNTAEGQAALLSLTTGGFNTAVGYLSLRSNVIGQLNTAIGAGTLLANTNDENTATGAGALFSNTDGYFNTANGAFALFSNTGGRANVANGVFALFSNTMGDDNTAIGYQTLYSNTTGIHNTANGINSLYNNTTGSENIAVGFNAGNNVSMASNVICIGSPGEDSGNSCYIGNIFGSTSSGGVAVFVNSDGRLGTVTSSARFKNDIKPMDKASEALLALRPVSFRYKKDIDPKGLSQFGLVAEEVEKVNRDLVVRDKDGKPYSVRYDQLNAMLLNEFLKEHHQVQEQKAVVAQLKQDFQSRLAEQQKQIAALTAGL